VGAGGDRGGRGGWSVVFAVGFFACVLVHELAHALAARTVGVATTEIRLFVFGGVARIAGEPADAGAEALVAMAGPLASVTMAGLFDLASWRVAGPAGDLLAWLFLGNLVVAGSTCCPGFPWTVGGWPGRWSGGSPGGACSPPE
jgi:Zn-dependent protease